MTIDWGPWVYPAVGFAGGILGTCARDGRLEVPSAYVETRGTRTKRYLDPGFLVSPAMGAMVAGMIDGNSWYAMAAAVCVGYLGPKLAYQRIIAPMLEGKAPHYSEHPKETSGSSEGEQPHGGE